MAFFLYHLTGQRSVTSCQSQTVYCVNRVRLVFAQLHFGCIADKHAAVIALFTHSKQQIASFVV